MDVHFHVRICIEYRLAQLAVDLHGVHGIPFVCASCLYLKSLVSFRIHLPHIGNNVFFQFFDLSDRLSHNRADSHESEYFLKAFYRLLIIIFAFTVHVYSSVAFMHDKLSVHIF